MRSRHALAAFALLSLACSDSAAGPGTGGNPPPAGSIALALQPVASGLSAPLFLTAPANDPRLFVVEQGGAIKVIKNGSMLPTPFLQLTGISTGGEQGLLGLAFDPAFATNRRFFVSYTDANGNSVVASYLASTGNPDVADPSSGVIRIGPITQPAANHNGGMIAFGPDGYLYYGLGDGGGGGDTFGNGQRTTDLLGDILRLDVSGATGYAVPADNPFRTTSGYAPEIWSIGLRNPWRFSFDRQTGDLYIGDVGQGAFEEIDFSPATSGRNAGRGLNYGWNTMEGKSCFSPSTNCSQAGLTLPVLDYAHDASGGCSVTGGYVYRGTAIAGLAGNYFFADFCQGWVRSIKASPGAATDTTDWAALRPGGSITSFGEDAAGELYVIGASGTVHKIVKQ